MKSLFPGLSFLVLMGMGLEKGRALLTGKEKKRLLDPHVDPVDFYGCPNLVS